MYTPTPHLDDVARERLADASSAHPLPVDREVLKKVVARRMRRSVEKVEFISAGSSTHHTLPSFCR
jgi:hypothetical protein